jgi:hypothetical protein
MPVNAESWQREWTPRQRLATAGEGTQGNLVARGWIESLVSDVGPVCYWVTELDKQVYKIAKPLRYQELPLIIQTKPTGLLSSRDVWKSRKRE